MRRRVLFALTFLLLSAATGRAYVDISPTLGYIIKDSTSIVVLEIDKVSLEKRGIIFKKIADLKAPLAKAAAGDVMRHHLERGSHPREPRIVLDWAQPGKLALAFVNGNSAV